MKNINLSYREHTESGFLDMLTRKHVFYKCDECQLYTRREGITGLCNHPDTQVLTQATHKECPFKIKIGG